MAACENTVTLNHDNTMTEFVEQYKPEWKKAFEDIKQVLEAELNGLSTKIDIQHIGSTAIPKMLAKPILDIDIIIHDKSLLNSISTRLEKIGYKNKGEQGIAGRFAFRQTSDFTPFTSTNNKWQSHHLYVCFSDSLALKNHLLFRDALLNNHELADRYSQLKKNLVEELGMTREEYTRRKTDFILAVLGKEGFEKAELNEIGDANL